MELIAGTQIIRLIAALALVLALMLGLNLFIRRVQGHNGVNRLGQKRRLSVIEVTPLDGRRRLVLLRRDDREHLVILGATGETVVETGITISATDENKNDAA